MAGLRVVLDTNVLVSGLAYPGSISGHIVSLWRQGGLEVVLSRYILDEISRVLPRMSRIQLTPGEIRDLVDSLMFLPTSSILILNRMRTCAMLRTNKCSQRCEQHGQTI